MLLVPFLENRAVGAPRMAAHVSLAFDPVVVAPLVAWYAALL